MSKDPLFYNPDNKPITWLDYLELEQLIRILSTQSEESK